MRTFLFVAEWGCRHHRRLAALVAIILLVGCGPIKINVPFGEVPHVIPPKEPVLLLKSLDARGLEQEGSMRTTDVHLPGTTSVTLTGRTAWVTTTPSQTVSLPTSYQFGQAGIDMVDKIVRVYVDAAPGLGKQVLDGSSRVLLALDEAQVLRACQNANVRRAIVMQVHRLEFSSDAAVDQFSWALLGGVTLGLAMPFVALKRWHGSVAMKATLYLYEVGKGFTRQSRYDQAHATQGCCLPGWSAVLEGVLPWAISHLGAELTQAIAKLAS